MADPSPESLLPLPTAVFHILIALADRDRHGYSIMQDVAARTDGTVQLSAGTLYSSIRRMLEQGLIDELRGEPRPDRARTSAAATTGSTRFGRRVAAAEVARLNALVQQARATGLVPEGMMRIEAIFNARCCAAIPRRSATSTASRCARCSTSSCATPRANAATRRAGASWRARRATRLHGRAARSTGTSCRRTSATRCARCWRGRDSRPSRLLSLALGIGANTAIFSLWHGVLHAPLPGVTAAGRTGDADRTRTRPAAGPAAGTAAPTAPRSWVTYQEFEELSDTPTASRR